MDVTIQRSKRKDKKFDAIIEGKKTVSFGAKGYADYTMHKDPERKQSYVRRHRKNEDWTDPRTAGFYAKHVLWNKPTLQESVKDINKRFKGINVKIA